MLLILLCVSCFVEMHMTRQRGLRHRVSPLRVIPALIRRNAYDPSEGIETRSEGIFLGDNKVEMHMTRQRGLRQF